MATYYVYLLELKDGRIYTGHCNSLPRRNREHASGKGCRTTAVFGAGEVIYVEAHPDRRSAVRREMQIRKWSRAKKLALTDGDIHRLKQLSRCKARN